MTWGEFKKKVEEEGVTDDMPIWYIDVSFPEEKTLDVYPYDKEIKSPDLGLVIQ